MTVWRSFLAGCVVGTIGVASVSAFAALIMVVS